jgi:hypothetical protein
VRVRWRGIHGAVGPGERCEYTQGTDSGGDERARSILRNQYSLIVSYRMEFQLHSILQ